jgi:hypothetical protein
MKLVIHRVSCWEHPNVRTWEPPDPDDVAEELMLDIGSRGNRGTDNFTLRVATPKGLSRSPSERGIIAARLLVMARYDYDDLWSWLEKTVEACEAETWLDCVAKLSRYFFWEYEGINY